MIEPARKLAAKIPDVHTTYWTSKLLSKIKSEQESEVNYISRLSGHPSFVANSDFLCRGMYAAGCMPRTNKYLGVQQTNWNIRKENAEAYTSE